MIEEIRDKLTEIEQHLDNINELIPGMTEINSLVLLEQLSTAEASMREVYAHLCNTAAYGGIKYGHTFATGN